MAFFGEPLRLMSREDVIAVVGWLLTQLDEREATVASRTIARRNPLKPEHKAMGYVPRPKPASPRR